MTQTKSNVFEVLLTQSDVFGSVSMSVGHYHVHMRGFKGEAGAEATALLCTSLTRKMWAKS